MFPLTASEYTLIAENLAADGIKMGKIASHLDVPKDNFHMGRHLSPLFYAKTLVTVYQSQSGASREKLRDALCKVGLNLTADIIALPGHKKQV